MRYYNFRKYCRNTQFFRKEYYGRERLYIQVALFVADEEKRLQETNSFSRIKDSFSKLVLVKEPIIPWQDENGVRYMGIQEWLKDSGKFSERKDI